MYVSRDQFVRPLEIIDKSYLWEFGGIEEM